MAVEEKVVHNGRNLLSDRILKAITSFGRDVETIETTVVCKGVFYVIKIVTIKQN